MMNMNTALETSKPWYLRQLYQAIAIGLLAGLTGYKLLRNLEGSKTAFWMELMKMVGLMGFFIQRVYLFRKHPESEWYIYDGFTWATLISLITDWAWGTQIGIFH
jgi:hypothetical protein